MSDYWKKKMDELNKSNAKKTETKSTKSSSSTKKTSSSSSSDYWGSKMAELEESNKKKKAAEEEAKKKQEYLKQEESRIDAIPDYAPIKQAAKDELRSQLGSTLSNIVNRTNSAIEPIKPIAKEAGKIELFQAGAYDDVDLSGPWYEDVGNIALATGQAILGTGADAVVGITKGGLKYSEGIADSIAYGIADVGEFFGADMDHIKEEADYNTIDEMFADTDEYLDKYSLFGRTTDYLAEGVGQLGTMYATASLGKLAKLGLLGTTALTTGTNWLSSYGGSRSEAKQSGATDEEARKYASIAATADAVTEMFFSGLGKGINAVGYSKGLFSADDMLAKALTKNIESKLAKNLVQYGVKAGAESFEEVLAGFAQAWGKHQTYMSEEDLWDIVRDENLLEQAVVAALTSAIAQGGDLAKANKSGRDFITGLNTDEQTVVDKAVQASIDEKEKKYGRELTNKEKNEVAKETRSALERGGLNIDSIAEYLGGETVDAFIAERDKFFGSEAYQAMREAERNEQSLPELQKKYDELHAIMPEKKTGAQQNEEASLFEQIQAIKNAPKSSDLRAQLDPEAQRLAGMRNNMHQEILARVKDSLLAESYAEHARSKQKLDIDIDKYKDENARKTVQAIVDSGLGDNSNAFKNWVDFLAKISADKKTIAFDLTSNERLYGTDHSRTGLTTNGYKLTDENGTTIVINKDAANPLRVVVGHEFTHALEGSQFYNDIADSVMKYAETKEGKANLQARIDEATRIYKDDANTTPEKEVVADLIGEYVFTDYDFVSNLASTNPKGFMKLFTEVKYLARIATAGSKEARELAKVKNNFERAYREFGVANSEADGGVQHSYYKPNFNQAEWSIVNRRKYSEFDNPKFDLDNDKKWMYVNEKGSTVFAIYSKHDPDDPTILYGSSGKKAESDYDVLNSYWRGELNVKRTKTNPNRRTLNAILADLNSATRDESYGISSATEGESATGNVQLPIAERGSNGRGDFADGSTNLRANEVTEYNDEASDDSDASFITFSNDYNTIRNYMKDGDKPDSDAQYSFSKDSAGNQLSKAQIDYFKDSKARDKDGNLLKVYHSTNNDFTVFDKGRKGETTGDHNTYLGFFFADDPEYMSQFPEFENGKTETYYLNMKNPIDMNNISKQALLDIVEATGGDVQEAAELYDQEYADELKRAKFRGDNSPIMEMSRLLEELTGEYFDYAEFYNALKPNYDQLMSKGYDGIINSLDGRGFANEYIVLDSNQAKLTTNENPSANPDVRFSFSKPVEETKDLVALHNLTQTKLLKSLELGGLPMPSIAITKANIPHDNFGEITLILGKDSIDPKANKKNVVYSADAWTPTFPSVEYESDSNVERQINRKLLDLATKVEEVFKHDIDMLRYGHEDNLNRYGGEEGLIQHAMEKYGFKAAYLEDQGHHIENITKQVEEDKKFNPANADKYEQVMDVLGVTTASEIGKLNLKETVEQHGEDLEAIYPGVTKSAMRFGRFLGIVQAYIENKDSGTVYRTVTDESAMRKAVDDALDAEGFEVWTRNLFSGIVKDSGIYNNKDIFTPSGKRRSFKQTHLPFTLENIVKAMASQNQGNTKNVSGFNGIKSLRAGTAERFKSIEAMHERKGRLQHLTQEEADKINDDLSKRLFAIIETIDNESGDHSVSNSFIRFDSIGEILMEVSEGGKYNVADIQNVFAQYRHNISDDLAADIKQLLFDVSQMPVNIYEAKPERAVSFDEVGVFVIPRNADVKLKQELLNRGYNIAEYDPDTEGDRQKVVNQFEEYKFSLSDAGKERNRPIATTDYDSRLYSDPFAEFAPVRQDVEETTAAPVAETATISETETVENPFPNDLAPLDAELDSLNQRKEVLENELREAIATEDADAFNQANAEYDKVLSRIAELEQEANEADADRLDSITDEDAPPEIERTNDTQADVVDLTKKDITDIARVVKDSLSLTGKQMYDVHKLIEDYSQNEFPSRVQLFQDIKDKLGTYTEKFKDQGTADAKKYLRTVSIAVDDTIRGDIADFADLRRNNRGKIRFSRNGIPVDVAYQELSGEYPYLFPKSILNPTDQFLQMVEVANKDSIAKVEHPIDDNALWGVTDDIIEYIDDIKRNRKEADAAKYSKESFNSLMADADNYVPPIDDVAPVPVAENTQVVENVTPTEEHPTAEAQKPVSETIDEKISAFQAQLDNNRKLRNESNSSFDQEIARLQAEYDAKTNKNTIGANNLLRRIERMKRLKQTVDADFGKQISNLESKVEKMSKPEYRTAEQRKVKDQEHTEHWKSLVGDTSTWKDMSLGLSYKTKTLRRILRKVVRDANGNPDIAKADAIYDALETKYDHNEALLKRESQKLKEVFQKLKLNSKEDTYAHMLGEFRHNPETTLTEDAVKDYYNKHKDRIDTNKVETAITEARKTFDELIVRVNEVLRAQGLKEIPYRKGYFPHFTNPKQGWIAKLLNWKTVDNEIPTSIAGLTEMFKPERSWQSFNKQRKGDTTDYSLYQGLDTYIHGALDWIYHIDDLQSRRSLENYLRYIHSDEGVKARIDEIKANETYDADETQAMIDSVYKEANNPLSGLVRELMNRTNTLANKKSSLDRQAEELTRRKVYSTLTNINNRINANMVVGSISSALTNFIPIVQSWGQVSPWFSVRGLGDYVRSVVKDDGMIEKSDFLTNRLIEEERLYLTEWDKVTDKIAFIGNVVDSIASQTVWRSKYLQNIKEGMSESQAIKDADQFAKNVIAGRSRGNAPSIFDAKNPAAKMFTAFQLEVANQYGYMLDDMVKDSKNPLRLVKGYAALFLGSHIYNALYSSLVGRNAAFDPIRIIEELLSDLGVGGDDEEEEEKEFGDVLLGLGESIIQEVPFVGGLFGGGRVPISAALPYSNDSTPFQSLLSDVEKGWNDGDPFNLKNWEPLAKEVLKPLYYLLIPVGGGQIKKTVEGLSMFSDDHPVAGSYTDSGKLRLPVEDTFGNRIQAAVFGQYASENARYYFDNDIAPLGEKQIDEYVDVYIPIRDYWKYRKELSGLDTVAEKLDYIDSLDLATWQKDILANNVTDRKEDIDMGEFGKYSGLEEYDFANKNEEVYNFIKSQGISYSEYSRYDDDKKDACRWAAKNPEKYTVSKAISDDLFDYYGIKGEINDIKENNDSNSGIKDKDLVVDYINGLDLDYGQKIILYRSMYGSKQDKKDYNNVIVDYLNSRNDISYEEMVTILEELDMKVDSKGNVTWD